ncbi:MAG: hypothetical protein WCC04_07925 [Terriglobales bacterium]
MIIHQATRIVGGFLVLIAGAIGYSRHGGAIPLIALVTGAIVITVNLVEMGARQALRDEFKRRDLESKPVLNI